MDLVLDRGRPRSGRAAGGGLVLDRLKALVRSLLLRRRLDEDMDDEMHFYIEQYQRDLVRSGVPPPEAARRPRKECVDVRLAKEEGREAKGLPMVDIFVLNL